MNNFIPNELKDVTKSKERIMRNVVNDIQHKPKRSKHHWTYGVLAAVFTISVTLFILNEVVIKNEPSIVEQPPPTNQSIDGSKPTVFEEQGLFYMSGVTLGDSQSTVIEVFGEDFTLLNEQADGSEADFVMDYGGQMRVSFIDDKVESIEFTHVDEAYFDTLFHAYDGFKFIYFDITDDRFFYSTETHQLVTASLDSINENLTLTLAYADERWKETAEYLSVTQQNIANQHLSSTNVTVDFTKPTFSEEDGFLYIHGLTLGVSPATLIERLGANYMIGKADGSVADFILQYEEVASFLFYNNKLDTIILQNVQQDHFDELYNAYDGFKFTSSTHEMDTDRFIYAIASGQTLKATTQTPNNDLYLYVSYPGPEFWENAEMQGHPNPWE